MPAEFQELSRETARLLRRLQDDRRRLKIFTNDHGANGGDSHEEINVEFTIDTQCIPTVTSNWK